MSYASGTTHYNLPQTVGSDKRDWTDTNQAFSDIDAAIYGAAQGASAATSAIETINGEIETITGKQAVDEGNISTLSGKVSTLESTVGTQGAAIADVRQDLQDNIESKREASATSTHAYNVGDTFYYNDVLYKATAQIAIGGTIVPSTNCTAITVMSEIQSQAAESSVNVTTVATDTYADLVSKVAAAVDMTKLCTTSTLVAPTGEIYNIQTLKGSDFKFNMIDTSTIRHFSHFSNANTAYVNSYVTNAWNLTNITATTIGSGYVGTWKVVY